MAGLVFLGLLVVVATFAPLVAPHDPNAQTLTRILEDPSGDHLLGTDDVGRDLLSRLIFGARISLRAAVQTVAMAAVVALPLGLAAGYRGGRVDGLVMRVMDALFAFPPLVLALTIAALLGPSLNHASIAIAVVFVPNFVRLVRGQVLAVREEAYVEASRSVGASSGRIVRRHILPNVASPLIIQAALSFGYAMLAEASLSFLGLGERPPTATWGGMLRRAFDFVGTQPWQIVMPGGAIMLTVLAFNLVGDGLLDALGRELPVLRRDIRRAPPPAAPAPAPTAPVTPTGRAGEGAPPVLAVDGLTVELATSAGWLRVVDDMSFAIHAGETLGLVGESGGGKTMTALGVMGILPPRISRRAGSIRLGGRELVGLPPSELRRVQGREIGMVFQEPMSSLNPAFTVGNQIAEVVRHHWGWSRRAAWTRAVELLDRVGLPDAAARARDYPHAFSGGMRQRAMLAMALACDPKVLLADEPTTALDVTIQAQILDLLDDLQRDAGLAVLFVTHDLGVVAEVCDRVVVMRAGQKVEEAAVEDVFDRPRHPYTQSLLASLLTLRATP
jgi:peptide/nickel transport system permease protein